MHLTWKQRKALKIVEIIAKIESYKNLPWWESIPKASVALHEAQMVALEPQYYDAAAKTICACTRTVDLPSGFDIVITQGENKC